MTKARLLIVEDDIDVSNMLRIYFTRQDYEVDTAFQGSQALEKTSQNLPHLVLLDILLPDIDGFEVCRILRNNARTSHVPIIFLTQKDERADKLRGLEIGGDDYITKPFDIEELKVRIQRAITRAEQQSLTDPRSGLPSGRLIEEQLRRIIRSNGWCFMDARIKDYDAFRELYGFVAGDNVQRFTAMLLREVIEELGAIDDFIGHAGGDNFVVITTEQAAPQVIRRLKERFEKEVLSHYSFLDRARGHIVAKGLDGKDQKVPLMSLVIGDVSSSQYQYTDIREITEMAAESRRRSE